MKISWDETKNQRNIAKHRIDFEDVFLTFEHPMLIKVDNRKDYGETRWVGLGVLYGAIISVVYTMREDKIRLISVRRANYNERKAYKERFERKD